MIRLLVASTNPGKILEIRQLLRARHVEVLGVTDFRELKDIAVEETGVTFMENALLKARTYGRLSGIPTLADDSGLSVDALDGRPGVFSKRYGETDSKRITKLLEEMKSIPKPRRSAHFTCALVLYNPSGDKAKMVEGRVDGEICREPKGNHGFGYDPIFFCPELNCTFGEAKAEQKDAVSHRARALAQLEKPLKHLLK